MGVSKNNGTPKSSILIGFSIINHPFWGTPIFGNILIPLFYRVLFPSQGFLNHQQYVPFPPDDSIHLMSHGYPG